MAITYPGGVKVTIHRSDGANQPTPTPKLRQNRARGEAPASTAAQAASPNRVIGHQPQGGSPAATATPAVNDPAMARGRAGAQPSPGSDGSAGSAGCVSADGVSEKSGGWASSTGSVHQTVPMSAYPDTQSCCTSAPNRGVEAPADARVGFRVGSRCRTGEWGAPSGGCLGSRVGSLCRTREWKARPGGCLGSRVGSRCRTGEWGALPGGCLGSRVGADVVGGWW